MPELPEVETIVNKLRSRLVGRRVVSVWVGWERIVDCPEPQEFRRRLKGQEFAAAKRRGKFLVLSLASGDTLLVHLRMTGTLLLHPSAVDPDEHTHAIIGLDDGMQLHYRDVRKFGRLYLLDEPERVLGSLGPEPLAADFDLPALTARLAGRSARIKSLLLDQRVVAGLGNIYVDETLFLAGIHPLRCADDLGDDELARLYEAMRTVLSEAIAAGGSTLRDYRPAAGVSGGYQEQLAVFRQQGEPCPRCGVTLERLRVGGRSTHFCPCCQPVAALSSEADSREV